MRIFVEGGGDQRRTQTACRKAFSLFFAKLLGDRPKPRVIPSGSRNQAYGDFCRSLEDGDAFPILLVDSEDPVQAGKTAVQHLRDRDQWTKPLPDGQVHLMVQCMEAWFLTDRGVLTQYYGSQIRMSALPANPQVESISKNDILQGLANATKETTKGSYHKCVFRAMPISVPR